MNESFGQERRTLRGEIRLVKEGNQLPRIVGYAAIFDQWSDDLGDFREIVRPGAFTKTIQGDIRALFNHNPIHVLGRNKAGTLRLWEDKRGLAVEILPPNTDWAAGVVESIRRGDVDGMSFGFATVRDRWNANGQVSRELLEVKLYDVGPATFPAYPQTEVSLQVRARASELQRNLAARRRLDVLRRRLVLEEQAI